VNETNTMYVSYNYLIDEFAETKSNDSYKNVLTNDLVRFTFNKNGLHVVHINIQHLLPKLDEIKCHLYDQSSIDSFSMGETFLHSDVDDNSFQIKHFKFERRDLLQKVAGS